MCDYSLYAIPNRLAREDEDLVAFRFPTGSMGLASPQEVARVQERTRPARKGFWANLRELLDPPSPAVVCAVCVPPGARLQLSGIPAAVQRQFAVQATEAVTFVQTSAMANTYRDAVRFANGAVLRLQELREGQQVRILSLECAEAVVEGIDWEAIEPARAGR